MQSAELGFGEGAGANLPAWTRCQRSFNDHMGAGPVSQLSRKPPLQTPCRGIACSRPDSEPTTKWAALLSAQVTHPSHAHNDLAEHEGSDRLQAMAV